MTAVTGQPVFKVKSVLGVGHAHCSTTARGEAPPTDTQGGMEQAPGVATREAFQGCLGGVSAGGRDPDNVVWGAGTAGRSGAWQGAARRGGRGAAGRCEAWRGAVGRGGARRGAVGRSGGRWWPGSRHCTRGGRLRV